jgi:glycosyltransferase involved in cell wall biosynthesis
MVQEAATGLLVPEGQPLPLANAMARLLRDRALSRSLGEAGRRRASELFAIEKSVAALRALYRQVGVD